MSDKIDLTRRKWFKLLAMLGLTTAVAKLVNADALNDLLITTASATKGESRQDTVAQNVVNSASNENAQNGLNQIIAVRLWPSSVYTRIAIEARNNIAADYKFVTTANNDRLLLIDIKQAQLNAVLQSIEHKVLNEDPIISKVHVAQINHDMVGLNVYLKQAINVQTRTIAPVSLNNVSYQYRYVIDMYPQQTAQLSDSTLSSKVIESTLATASQLNDDMLALLELGGDGEEHQQEVGNVEANATTDSIMQAANSAKMPVNTKLAKWTYIKRKKHDKLLVMIDPGHGGEDPGAVGPTGTYEKHVVLDIAKKLHDNIQNSDYLLSALTRNQDIFIPLGARVAIARRARADIFVSVHADAFITPNARGSSVFMLSNKGASSTFARWLARTQNKADLIGGMSFNSKDKLTNSVLLDMTQSWSLDESNQLGKSLLSNLRNVGKLHNMQVEKAAFAVLKAPDIPSVLVETAFISNPYEEQRLQQPEFRQKLALAIYSGINNFAQTNLCT